jgi:hypothetical protein
MMLASTVQFSKYGRFRLPAAVRLRASRPCRGWPDWRPFPQDPTACSACATPGIRLPVLLSLATERPY